MTTAFSNNKSSLEELLSQPPWKNLRMVGMEQVHGKEVTILNNNKNSDSRIPHADGVLTSQPGIGLLVRTADCLPILLHHKSGLIGALHAGRKGTEKGILANALSIIKNEFGISEGLEVWFGPAICGNCYEINRETGLHYDLTRENLTQLQSIFPDGTYQLKIAGICTLEHPDYYSYRQTGPGVKLNYFVITQ